jgi:hypothetical protein
VSRYGLLHLDGQPFAAFAAAALEYPATARGLHAGTESMDALTASLFRLPCTFRHTFSYFEHVADATFVYDKCTVGYYTRFGENSQIVWGC